MDSSIPDSVLGYSLLSKLGSGSFATVHLGVRPDGQTAAIKIISLPGLSERIIQNLDVEISVLRSHDHPNIVRLQDVETGPKRVCLVLEYCRGGDLRGLLRTNGRVEEWTCRRIARDLASGLAFLHGRSLVHRDIKPQNLLLSEEFEGGDWCLKIADFGFARYLAGVDLAETMCGSPLYMAPEILLGRKYDGKADLWSVGTVLFELISGRTPFHGENHMDLLNNIKRKAVRLPPEVRVSREFVTLLRILLDRKPQTRADFRGFYAAAGAFVALGCDGGGLPELPRDVTPRMDLCAITEDEGESDGIGAGVRPGICGNVETAEDDRGGNVPGQHTQILARKEPTRIGVVTPQFGSMPTPIPPPVIQAGVPNVRCIGRPYVFAPLQGSPNISPSITPVKTNFHTLQLQNGGSALSNSKQLSIRARQDKFGPSTLNDYQNSMAFLEGHSQRSSSSQEASDSGFVLVEHGGTQTSSSLAKKYPQDGLCGSPAASHNYSSSRNITSGGTGILGTSPATGHALCKMLIGSPPTKTGIPAAPVSNFHSSPRSSRNGGCLAHIESLARMLAAAEDVGRRAISVAHLGDTRATLAMGIAIGRRGSQSSSSCAPMDEVEDDGFRSSTARASMRAALSTRKAIIEEDEEDNEFPFAMTTSMEDGSDEMSQSPAGNIMSNLAQIIGNVGNTETSSKEAEDDGPAAIRVHFREALLCYLKTLTMMKGSIRAAQTVFSEIDEVMRLPSARPPPNTNNPYAPLHKRCSASLEWLRIQFSAVLERADAASEHSSLVESSPATASLEELIYDHSLRCGREGAVKQILGHIDAARSCYRSAGLLAETLLMDPKVGEGDRMILEGYVRSFADQIMELDGSVQHRPRTMSASGRGNVP